MSVFQNKKITLLLIGVSSLVMLQGCLHFQTKQEVAEVGIFYLDTVYVNGTPSSVRYTIHNKQQNSICFGEGIVSTGSSPLVVVQAQDRDGKRIKPKPEGLLTNESWENILLLPKEKIVTKINFPDYLESPLQQKYPIMLKLSIPVAICKSNDFIFSKPDIYLESEWLQIALK